MSENLTEAARHATPEGIAAHYEAVNAETVRWSHLEYANRIAQRHLDRLRSELLTVEDRDVKELLAHVISIGDVYVSELERQRDNGAPLESLKPEKFEQFAKSHLDAQWWTEAIRKVWPQPRESQQIAIELLQAASAFFLATIAPFFSWEQGE
jgi:hypothetical protein